MLHELERLSTIGRPLMTMPSLISSSRMPVTGKPALLGPSPDTSITRRMPRTPLLASSALENVSAAEIDVMRAREIGAASSWSANGLGGRGAVDDGPGDHHRLAGRPRPFHVGDGDAPVRPRGDGLLHLGIAQGLHVAVALQALLVHVHGQRHVHGQDQLEIHRRLRQDSLRQTASKATDTSTKSNDFSSKAGMSDNLAQAKPCWKTHLAGCSSTFAHLRIESIPSFLRRYPQVPQTHLRYQKTYVGRTATVCGPERVCVRRE